MMLKYGILLKIDILHVGISLEATLSPVLSLIDNPREELNSAEFHTVSPVTPVVFSPCDPYSSRLGYPKNNFFVLSSCPGLWIRCPSGSLSRQESAVLARVGV